MTLDFLSSTLQGKGVLYVMLLEISVAEGDIFQPKPGKELLAS